MADVRLTVNGREFGGWTSVAITRGIEAIAGKFNLSVSERWSLDVDPWAIQEEDECTLAIGEDVLITGWVDERDLSYGSDAHTLRVSGRDRAGALVDCSAVLSQWEFSNTPILDLCTKVAAPFGVAVTLQDGLDDKAISTKPKASASRGGGAPSAVGSAGKSSSLRIGQPNAKLTINPGDSAFEVIDRACRMVGVLPVSDGRGGIVLTRAGGTMATTALVEGENILSGAVTFDASRRYRKYIVSGQSAGSDEIFGPSAAAVKQEAIDNRVRRAERVLYLRPDGVVTLAFAKQRAAWEASVRAARSISASITVQGWHQADGSLWPINARVAVKSPKLAIDAEMLIAEAEYSVDPRAGSTTTLRIVPKDAFIPEPVIIDTGANTGSSWLS